MLERLLQEEQKKSEDLQFSVDEATFCSDELNVRVCFFNSYTLLKYYVRILINKGPTDLMKDLIVERGY